jgi:hypothetical protein
MGRRCKIKDQETTDLTQYFILTNEKDEKKYLSCGCSIHQAEKIDKDLRCKKCSKKLLTYCQICKIFINHQHFD